jgi:[ribosomal protein S5]-alanine N-acetyltransferase
MLQFSFYPFPNLSTSRMDLLMLEPEHADQLFLLRSDPKVMHFIPRPIATSAQDALELIEKKKSGIDKNESINWGMFLKENNQLIGTIGFVRSNPEHHRAEIGYLLGTDHQGKGLMHEALERVIEYGFKNMKLHSIEAVIDPENTASVNLVKRHGFIKEAHFKERELVKGKFKDICVFTKLTTLR